MTDDDWSVLEDDIADALNDSMEMDWTVDVGAEAVVAMLKSHGYEIKPPEFGNDD